MSACTLHTTVMYFYSQLHVVRFADVTVSDQHWVSIELTF